MPKLKEMASAANTEGCVIRQLAIKVDLEFGTEIKVWSHKYMLKN